MTDPVNTVPAGEAAAAVEVIAQGPPVNTIKAAADAGRALLAKQATTAAATAAAESAAEAAAGAEVGDDARPPDEAVVARTADEEAALAATETPDETEARHTAEAEAREAAEAAATPGEALRVKLPGVREGDDEFEIEVGDKETAERLNQLKRGYARREQAEQIRDDAQRVRDEADDIKYAAELDPGEIVLTGLQDARDVDHLTRFLFTRAGVLERNRDFLITLLEQPEGLATQAALLDAERVTRREQVKGEIQTKMAFDTNARQLLRTLDKSATSLAPSAMDDDGLALLKRDVRQDMIAVVNFQIRQYCEANGIPLGRDGRPTQPLPIAVRMLDPRQVPGLIQRRFKLMGVAPRSATSPAANGTPPAGTKRPAGKVPLTPEALKAARTARAAAASAPPGAGSPVAQVPKAPTYDPKQKGSAIQQAAAHARRFMSGLTKAPQ